MQQSNGATAEQGGGGGGGGQQWVPMPYPVVMPMPYAGHYMPYPSPQHYMQQQQQFHHHHTPQHNGGSNNGENKTIWVGDLQTWMEEDYLRHCFSSAGEANSIVNIKVIRNKQNQMSEGYGFVQFTSHEVADKVLQDYSGKPMPNAETPFRLNWATFSMGDKRSNNNGSPDLSIFVGDLAPDVTDTMLHETFSSKYDSVKAAKVVMDASTGRSKGYGFVRFGDEKERSQAMTEMNGVLCSSRAMRIGAATPRKSSAYQQHYSQGGYVPNGASAQGFQSDGDSTNTTIFVGGLDPNVTDEDLKQPFSDYGEILSVKIPVGKGCGFVQFSKRSEAEEALQKLSGTTIGNQPVRLSWGRNPGNKQMRSDFGNQWNGPYFGGPMYEGYGFAVPPPHDPRMYAAAAAAAYGAYPMYGSPQQQVN